MATNADTGATPASAQAPAGLPPEMASARERWASYGHDLARFDAAISGDAAQPVSTPADTANPAPAAQGGRLGLSEAQAKAMADRLIAVGVPEDQVRAALNAEGFEVPEVTAETQAQADHDAAHGFASKWSPSDYRPNYLEHGGKGMDPVQLANANREVTAFLAALQIEPTLGAAIAERVMDVSQAVAKMTPAEHSLWKTENRQIVTRRAGGAHQAQETVRLAAVALKAAGPGEFRSVLLERAINDSWLMETLANFGARWESWRAGPKKPTAPGAA